VILVSYQQLGVERPAEFTVLSADLPPDADLQAFLIADRVGPDAWTPRPPPGPVTVNGVDATRYLLTRRQGKDEIRREVTAFRRGDRVYFFLVTFATTDETVRAAVRASLESITWTK
jgi:hypothetical protein